MSCFLLLTLLSALPAQSRINRAGNIDDNSALVDIGSILQDTSVELAPDMEKIGGEDIQPSSARACW